MADLPLFHLAFGVTDLASTRRFYGEVLGCAEGRSAERWVDFDLAGHQLSAHVVPGVGAAPTNPVDGDDVPIPHFGLILAWEAWEALAARVRAHGEGFVIEPRVRFQGGAGEQGTFFLRDPSGNHLEFKAFKRREQVFAREGSGGSPPA
ncbi:MAG: VOC family protein [Planctomycetota bacterium]